MPLYIDGEPRVSVPVFREPESSTSGHYVLWGALAYMVGLLSLGVSLLAGSVLGIVCGLVAVLGGGYVLTATAGER